MVKIHTACRRAREKEQRRNDIIEAAEKLFIAKGYENTSMDDIAAAVELSKPAIYRYFASKEDLYFAVVIRGSMILTQIMEEGVAAAKTGLDKIYATGVAFYKFCREYPDYAKMFMHVRSFESCCPESENLRVLAKAGGSSLTIMCAAIETGKKDGTIRKDADTFLTAVLFVEATIAAIQLSNGMMGALERNGKTHDEFVKYSLDLMMHSIESKK